MRTVAASAFAMNVLLADAFVSPTTGPSVRSTALSQSASLLPEYGAQSFTSPQAAAQGASASCSLAAGAAIGAAAAFAVSKSRRSTRQGQAKENLTACRANPVATFETSVGAFKAEIYLDQMPVTASNFIDLCKTGFYDGVHFHRVIPNFMAQFGCPLAKDPKSNRAGTGGPEDGTTFTVLDGSDKKIARINGGNIPDELICKIPNEPGTLSMANTGRPNSGGSQFFINVNNNSFLNWWDNSTPSQHPVFGKIIENYDLVKQITETRTDGRDNPVQPIMMKTISISE
eukprot:TRINITY_DN7187_c0_g3_i1.p1 TRINITY_DN7187_c0_g3~~TRINITY_DN7187_c0_g3_i1.p1  ORF type:complete len:287 (+),score=68.10 TRINITY_DN7187_c0_g3_i1:67-927(+)